MSRNGEALLAAAQGGTLALQSYFNTHGAKSEYFFYAGKKMKNLKELVQQLSETLQAFSQEHSKLIWKHLNIICIDLFKRREYLQSNGGNNEEMDRTKDELPLNEVMVLLNNICSLCFAAIVTENPYITKDLVETVLVFYGLLPVLTEHSDLLPKNICKLCIQWWKCDLPKKEELCLNVLIYLLSTITTYQSKNQALYWFSELHKIEKSIQLFDMTTNLVDNNNREVDRSMMEIIEELKQLLVKLATHPIVLNQSNGRTFLSNMLLLNKDMMKAMHNAIVNSIYSLASLSQCHLYGSLYYLTWTLADNEHKEMFEEICIQDVMYRAMYAPRNKVSSHCIFTSFQLLLRELNHKTLESTYMVEKLYSPIIWRSLKATNAMVRANAANLLFDAFPLRSNSSIEQQNELLQRHFTAIDNLVSDSQPQVRSLAIVGFCQIYTDHWDLIPAHVIAIQTRNICMNLAFDATSPKVREAVIKGMIILLSNPFSHQLLQKLLPLLSTAIHDTNEKVRLAFLNLLNNIKKTESLRFWDVCPVDRIISQLGVENHSVTAKIVELLFGSFLPSDQPIKVWVKRCCNFYSRDTKAARKFYHYAKHKLSVIEAQKFILQLAACVFGFVENNLADQTEENEKDDNAEDSQQGIAVDGLLETISILLQHVADKVPAMRRDRSLAEGKEMSVETRNLAKQIMLKLPLLLHSCFKKFHDKRNLNSLFQISGCMNPSSMPVLSKSLLPKLRSLPEDSPTYYIKMLIHCMVKWKMGLDLLSLIYDWFTASNSQPEQQKSSKKRKRSTSKTAKKSKLVCFIETTNDCRVAPALSYLRCCVDDHVIMDTLLADRQCFEKLESIIEFLNSCTVEVTKRLHNNDPTMDKWNDTMLINALDIQASLLAQVFTHQVESNTDTSTSVLPDSTQIANFIQSISGALLKPVRNLSDTGQVENLNTSILTAPTPNQPTCHGFLQRLGLCRKAICTVLPHLTHFLKCGVQVAGSCLEFMAAFLTADINITEYLADASAILCEVHEHLLLSDWSSEECDITDSCSTFLQCMSDFHLAMIAYSHQNSDGFCDTFKLSIRNPLRKIIQSQFSLSDSITRDTYAELSRKICSTVLADILENIKSSSSFAVPDKVTDLPTLSSNLVPILCATSAECDYVCQLVLDMHEEAQKGENKYAENLRESYICLLSVLSKDGKNKASATSALTRLNEDQLNATAT